MLHVVWLFCPGYCDIRTMTYTVVKTMIIIYVQAILQLFILMSEKVVGGEWTAQKQILYMYLIYPQAKAAPQVVLKTTSKQKLGREILKQEGSQCISEHAGCVPEAAFANTESCTSRRLCLQAQPWECL